MTKEKNETSQLLEVVIKSIQEKFKIYFGYTSELEDDFEITF